MSVDNLVALRYPLDLTALEAVAENISKVLIRSWMISTLQSELK